jgi:hypothetical protein
MNLIELVVFIALSGALLALGRYLAGFLGSVGWLIGIVPVGLFWAWVGFCNATLILRTLLSSLRNLCRDESAPGGRHSGR